MLGELGAIIEGDGFWLDWVCVQGLADLAHHALRVLSIGIVDDGEVAGFSVNQSNEIVFMAFEHD